MVEKEADESQDWIRRMGCLGAKCRGGRKVCCFPARNVGEVAKKEVGRSAPNRECMASSVGRYETEGCLNWGRFERGKASRMYFMEPRFGENG